MHLTFFVSQKPTDRSVNIRQGAKERKSSSREDLRSGSTIVPLSAMYLIKTRRPIFAFDLQEGGQEEGSERQGEGADLRRGNPVAPTADTHSH